MNLMDLHVHSNASDGTYSPTEVVEYGIEKQLRAIALTDHDTVAGVEEGITAAFGSSLELIPGIELSCYYRDREIHILGLDIDYKDEALDKELEKLRIIRENRNKEMLSRMNQAGIDITFEELCAGNPKTVITRAHFARALYDKGYVKTKNEAFKKYIGSNCPYYLPKPKLSPEKAMNILTNAKSIPVLAHPLLYKLGYKQIEELLVYLIPLGLKGLEVYHSSNNAFDSSKLRQLAYQYKLYPTGGSDFHGSNKPSIDLGCGRGGLRLSYALWKDIKAKQL